MQFGIIDEDDVRRFAKNEFNGELNLTDEEIEEIAFDADDDLGEAIINAYMLSESLSYAFDKFLKEHDKEDAA